MHCHKEFHFSCYRDTIRALVIPTKKFRIRVIIKSQTIPNIANV